MQKKSARQFKTADKNDLKRVALVNPPYSSYLYTKEIKLKSILPSLGLLYIHAYIKNHATVRLFDGELYGSFDELVEEIEDFNPHIIGYTSTSPTYALVQKISSHFRGKSFQLIAGAYATACHKEIARYFDVVLKNEGEEAILEIIQGKELEQIKGLTFLKEGKLIETPKRELRKDLDSLPFPSWEIIDFEKYQSSIHRKTGERFAPIITSRSCYFNCPYCSTKIINGPFVRVRSPQNVYEEMKLLKEKYGITHFQIWDDTFTFDKIRLAELCSFFQILDITYVCNTRPDYLDEVDIKLLKNSGCTNIFLGVESGDESILKYYQRTMSLSSVKKAFSVCQKYGVKTTASFMIGAPIETEKTLLTTLKFAKSIKSDYVLFNILTPHKYTELYNNALLAGSLEPYEVDLEKYKNEPVGIPTLKNENLNRSDLLLWKQRLYKSYYFRLEYLLQQITRAKSRQDLNNSCKLIRTYLL